jgi:translation elongation factor EF-4
MTDLSHIRNFSIVAHNDQGESPLADRLVQHTGTVADPDIEENMGAMPFDGQRMINGRFTPIVTMGAEFPK